MRPSWPALIRLAALSATVAIPTISQALLKLELEFPLHALIAVCFGAVIGYCANRLAIWMLFNPPEPIRFLGLEFQGLIPKKRAVLAERVAEIIAADILSEEEIEELLKGAGEAVVREAIYERLSQVPLPPGLLDELVDLAASAATRASRDIAVKMARAIDVRAFVIEKANSLDPRGFSSMFHRAVGKELRWISLWDSMLGATMGLVEALLFSFLSP